MKAAKIALAALVSTLAFAPMSVMAAPKTMPDGTLFDAEYYAANNPDVVAAFGTSEEALYTHYQLFGRREGRIPVAPPAAQITVSTDTTAFDPVYYASRYPDVVAALGSDPAILRAHYDICGKGEGRFANAAQEQAASKPQSSTQQSPATSQEAAVEACVRGAEYLNQLREAARKDRIEPSYAILNCAFTRAGELVERYSHERPNGTEYDTVLTEAGIGCEDVWESYVAGLGTPEEAIRHFIRCDEDVLMKNNYFSKIGLGFHYDAKAKGCYWVLLMVK